MDRIPERIDSKFRFVLLAAQRAEQMMVGAVAKVDMPGRKHSRIAMEEVSGDLIEWDYGPPTEAEDGAETEAAEAAESG